jgi:serine/threonine protein kinase
LSDLHIGNLSLTIPKLQQLSETQLLQTFGDPEIAPVKREDGKPLDPSVPDYIVTATSYRADVSPTIALTKIVDSGESFTRDDSPSTLRTPIAVRAPEVVFHDHLDYRVDMWSMGCLVSISTISTITPKQTADLS